MKQKVGPIAITVTVLGVIALLVVMYRMYFPPSQPPDTANPNSMPGYARDFMKNRGKTGNAIPGR